MRANLGKREPARVAHWENVNLYGKIQQKNQDGELFLLHDGPPFTNGDLHLGHALNKTLKEMVYPSSIRSPRRSEQLAKR